MIDREGSPQRPRDVGAPHYTDRVNLVGLIDLVATGRRRTAGRCAGVVRHQTDIAAPEAMRPLLVAALASAASAAAGDVHVPRAEQLTASLSSFQARTPSRTTPRGRRCRTNASRRARTRSDAGWRSCAAWPAPMSCPGPRSSSRRSGPSCSRRCRAWPTCVRSGSSPGRTSTSTTSPKPSWTPPTCASISSSGAASSPSGAASWTSFRPPGAPRPHRLLRRHDRGDPPFQVADQRSDAETLPEITASPCRELLISDAVRACPPRQLNGAIPAHLRDSSERIADGHAVDGMGPLTGPGRRAGLLIASCPPTRSSSSRSREGAGQGARARHLAGVPAGVLGCGRGR